MLFGEFRRFMNKMNAKNTILHNRFILYAIFFISVVHLFYTVIQRDYYTALVFIFTGILVSFFSKNMIVILCISLAVSYLLKNNANLEGFEEGIVDTGVSSDAAEMDNSNLDENQMDNENQIDENTNNQMTDENGNNETDENGNQTDEPEKKGAPVLSEEQSVIVSENKKGKKKGNNSESNSEIKDIIKEQNQLIKKLDKYEPFINTIQNIAKKFGFSDDELEEEEAE